MHRKNGATSALIDEYERAINDLKKVLATVTDKELVTIADTTTKDEDCLSIQTIMAHVVRSGYCYAIYIRNSHGENLGFPARKKLNSSKQIMDALDAMFSYNEQVFEDFPRLKLEEHSASKKMLVSWGQLYDVEQIIEHAIVHILRHRRQIERFLQLLR